MSKYCRTRIVYYATSDRLEVSNSVRVPNILRYLTHKRKAKGVIVPIY